MKLFKKHVKNEKGFPLVELLAVVVILGIIAAIAIPAIGTIMKNSEKDAHVVNAKQAANAMRMYVAENGNADSVEATLKQLEDGGYLENLLDPSDKSTTYNKATSKVTYTKKTDTAPPKYIVVLNKAGDKGANYINKPDKVAGELTRADITLQ